MKNIAFILLVLMLVLQPATARAQEDFEPEEMTSFMIQVPHGVDGSGLAVGGSNLSAYIFFESYYSGDMNVTLELDLPEGFVLQDTPVHSFSLQTEYDDWYRLVDIYIPEDLHSGTYDITATAVVDVNGNEHTIVRRTRLRVASKEEVADEITITGVIVPSDEDGYGDPSHPSNTLVIRETSPALKKLLKVTDLRIDRKELTSTFMGVEVSNKGENTIPVVITYDILDIRTGEPVKTFKPAILGMNADTFCYAALTLPPGSNSLVSLPLYVSDNAMGGNYLLRVKVKITGSDWIAVTEDQKITAVSRKWGPI
ncbi:MAG: hypothetical protein WC183_09535, partial [Methanosarcina sp.]